MRVRWIAANPDPSIASVRIRALSVVRALRDSGVDAAMLAGTGEPIDVAVFCKSYRRKDIELARNLKRRGTSVIFDLCDNHFLLNERIVSQLREMMSIADRWVFSTSALQALSIQAMGEDRNSCVIPDAVESEQASWVSSGLERRWSEWKLRRWQQRSVAQMASPAARLVWFGNHAGSANDSGMSQIDKLRPILESCAKEHSATLTVISNSRAAYEQITGGWRIPTFYLEWNLATFLQALRMHSIALLPFGINDFNSVKSNNRLALSLHHGLAVVADAIPSYREFADCTILDDWSGVGRYIQNEDLRRQHVELAQKRVREAFSIEIVAQRWRELLTQARP